MNSLASETKLILALDFPDAKSALAMVDYLGCEIDFYKIGLELMMGGEYFKLIEELKKRNKRVFADLKLYDISNTVAAAVKSLALHDIDLITIHAASHAIMARAAENKGKAKLIAVTNLTDLDLDDLKQIGFDPRLTIEDLAIKKTKMALDSGLDGVVSSALEAKVLRQNFGSNFLIVTPGIRLEKVEGDDQKRVADVATAIASGSSYLVVGRPITKALKPKNEAEKFLQLIAFTNNSRP